MIEETNEFASALRRALLKRVLKRVRLGEPFTFAASGPAHGLTQNAESQRSRRCAFTPYFLGILRSSALPSSSLFWPRAYWGRTAPNGSQSNPESLAATLLRVCATETQHGFDATVSNTLTKATCGADRLSVCHRITSGSPEQKPPRTGHAPRPQPTSVATTYAPGVALPSFPENLSKSVEVCLEVLSETRLSVSRVDASHEV